MPGGRHPLRPNEYELLEKLQQLEKKLPADQLPVQQQHIQTLQTQWSTLANNDKQPIDTAIQIFKTIKQTLELIQQDLNTKQVPISQLFKPANQSSDHVIIEINEETPLLFENMRL